MFDLKILAGRLKITRNANNLTQRQLAEKANVTAATISAYEKGAKNPSLESVANLATALNTSIDWLCGNDTDLSEPQTYGDIISKFVKVLCSMNFSIERVDEFFDGIARNWYTDIRIYDDTFETFLIDLGKMKKLIDEKTIDENIFNSWLDGQIKKYSIPLNKKDVDNGSDK